MFRVLSKLYFCTNQNAGVVNDILLLLGGNLGNREKILGQAIKKVEATIGLITDMSSVYETAPWGFSAEKAFLNQVIRVESLLTPHEILNKILAIERELGRKRGANGYNSRIIDIDILLINGFTIHDQALDIPHPRLHLRNFTLVPMAEIAGGWVHPELGKNIKEIAENCKDTLPVKLVKSRKK